MGNMTVREALGLAHMPVLVADRLSAVLGRRPSAWTNRLGAGGAQVITIARTLLRDPAVLVLVRPLAFVVPEERARLRQLLRLWQEGGAARIVQWLTPESAPLAGNGARLSPRTLVVTGEDMDDAGASPSGTCTT